ncbi:hypothetical protein HOB87_10440 [Candidatus Woesearchaeota archaeon]|jgi:hypothetical protein|nr:hypothetical protein [Candidatus Woesearchaeota archaeon]
MNLQKMTKKQLEAHGRTIGIELDRRKSKKDMITELIKASKTAKKKAPKKKASSVAKKKAPAKIVGKPTPPTKKKPAYVAPKHSFWDKVKNYFSF